MQQEITEFGMKIKFVLIRLGKTQEWLITKVCESTGLYFDSSYLYKIMTGKNKNRKIISAICEVLDIQEEAQVKDIHKR